MYPFSPIGSKNKLLVQARKLPPGADQYIGMSWARKDPFIVRSTNKVISPGGSRLKPKPGNTANRTEHERDHNISKQLLTTQSPMIKNILFQAN